jgi:hypothetical protein
VGQALSGGPAYFMRIKLDTAWGSTSSHAPGALTGLLRLNRKPTEGTDSQGRLVCPHLARLPVCCQLAAPHAPWHTQMILLLFESNSRRPKDHRAGSREYR